MKLFVWDNSKTYETQFFCVMAETQEQARALLLEKLNCFPEDLKDCADEYEFPVAFAITHYTPVRRR